MLHCLTGLRPSSSPCRRVFLLSLLEENLHKVDEKSSRNVTMAITLTLLATSRMAGGVLFLFAPKIAAANFSLPHGPSSSVLTHLVGARDLIIGALLYTAYQDKEKVLFSPPSL